MIEQLIDWTERGWVPDFALRAGIRRLLKQRLRETDRGSAEANGARRDELIAEFSSGPIALVPEKANEQHYEVPAELFALTLGPRKKYSSCLWNSETRNLAEAEEAALAETCARAELADGMRILELGCGWGSLSLWMAEKYPAAKITVVSNSNSQREFIETTAAERGIETNLTVITSDINDLSFDAVDDAEFDRVVSVEMFEHVRNHRELLRRISGWLQPDGKLFVHIFCHKELTYPFQDKNKSDWMSRYFFSGGIMPGIDLLPGYDEHMSLEKQWIWNGKNYQRTCEAWHDNLNANRDRALQVLTETYGQAEAVRWFHRWRMFYLACSELFGYADGNEWFVVHYRFTNNQ